MAQISDNINLELTTTEITLNSSTPGDGFIYSAIPLLDSIDDASQLEVYWNVKYVKRVDDSVKIDVDTLPADVRAQLRLLDGSLWQVDNDTKELFITSDLVNREVTAGGVAYMYGPDAGLGIDAPAVADNEYLEIRRATSLDSRLVNFQPGTRLTSANLNISNEQMFNALQEITKYGIFAIGGSETAGKPDLSNSSISELLDVATLTIPGSFLQWNGSAVVGSPISTGNFVPVTNTGAAEGEALVVTNTAGVGGYSWERLIAADINRRSGNSENLDSYLSTQSGVVQSIDSRTGTLESTTSELGYDSGTNTFSLTDNDIDMAGDITTTGDVTANDVIVDGTSVKDHIAADIPYWLVVNSKTTINNLISSTNTRVLGDDGQFDYDPAQDITGSNTTVDGVFVGDWKTNTGEWIAPRPMVIRAEARGNLARTIDPDDSNRHRTYSGDLKIYHEGVGVGKAHKHRVDALYGVVLDGSGTDDMFYSDDVVGGRDDSGHAYVILQVAAGDTIKFQIERNDIDSVDTSSGGTITGTPSEFKYTGAYITITEIR